MYFVDHLFDIFTVSKERDVDVGVAFDMFRTDVRLGETHEYNTGDALPGFDFKAASEEWNALTDEQKVREFDDWHEFMRAHYEDACTAFAEGREACEALAKRWEAEK